MKASDFRNKTWLEIQAAGWLVDFRREVWVSLLQQGPATTRELALRLAGNDAVRGGALLFTVRPRVTELVQAGVVVAEDGGGREGRYRALTEDELIALHGPAEPVRYEQAELIPA